MVRFSLAVILLAGSLGLYLGYYGRFQLSLAGALVSLLLTLVIIWLDIKSKSWVYSKSGRLSALIVFICFFFYFMFSGYVFLRVWHEAVGSKYVHFGGGHQIQLSSYGGRLCKYGVVIDAPVQFAGRKICVSRGEYVAFARDGKIDRFSSLIKIVFTEKRSLMGSTIFSIDVTL